MPWVAPVVSALVGAGTAIYQSHQNKKLTNLNNQANVELWNKQMEYNTPANQMQRYREAGLNPHLVSADAGNASSPPSMVAPQDSYASGVQGSLDRLANLKSMLLSWKAQEENIANIDAQIELANAKTQVEKEKLQDWRFKNLYGLSNYDTQNFLLRLRQSDLFNKYQLDWIADSPLNTWPLDSWANENGLGLGANFRPLSRSEIMKSLRYRQAESSLNYMNAGASLRNIQANWQSAQNAWGIPANAPWLVSVARKFIETTEKKRKEWLKYH